MSFQGKLNWLVKKAALRHTTHLQHKTSCFQKFAHHARNDQGVKILIFKIGFFSSILLCIFPLYIFWFPWIFSAQLFDCVWFMIHRECYYFFMVSHQPINSPQMIGLKAVSASVPARTLSTQNSMGTTQRFFCKRKLITQNDLCAINPVGGAWGAGASGSAYCPGDPGQTPHYPRLCCAMLGYLCHAVLCYVILCYVTLCCAMLCYVVLCYAMLCYVMLMLCYGI